MKRGMFGLITLREAANWEWSGYFCWKTRWAVVFNSMLKIYKALLKATEEVTSLTPVMEAKLEATVDRVIAEILERFPNGVRFMIQNIVEHEIASSQWICDCWELHYFHRTQRDFERSKASDINFMIGTRTKRLSMKMPIRTAMSLIRNGFDGRDRW